MTLRHLDIDLALYRVTHVLLRDEIGRLEADMAQKRSKRAAADQFFKK